jgi:lipopolysaccharide/colanic/teichoic acid biosynthesis glycosyltransferase
MLAMTAEPMAMNAATLLADPPAATARPSTITWNHDEAARALGAAAYACSKRALDVCGALLLLILLLPVFAAVALAILRDTGGPVFYRAERIGRSGRPFRVVKFRSMTAGCDQAAHAAFIKSLMQGTNCGVYKVPGDKRITRLGAFLRRTSIDELPQLWNVLRGDMSLVGPRPDVPYAVADYADWMRLRLAVRPGMTGLWQVSGRSRLSLLDMYRLDADYARRPSLLLDLRILARTVPAVLGHDGAA